MEKLLARVMNKKSLRSADDASTDDAFPGGDYLSSWVDVSSFSDDDETQYYCEDDGDLCVVKSTVDRDNRACLELVNDSPVPELYRPTCRQHSSIDEELHEYSNEEEDLDDGYDDDDGGGFDLDDELVPRSVSDRFGRQRMRKLGKRAYPKMNKSRKLPYYYSRPGCVYGKHGLGLKHSIIM
ncbi:hypothetical protein NMG60_11014766 [Bertholletia excelsa]